MGKKYTDSVKLIEKNRLYDPSEALGLVCQTSKAKFDETIEIHVKLGIDTKKADQQVRTTVALPHGTGKTKRIAVIAKGEHAQEAEKAAESIQNAAEEEKLVSVCYKALSDSIFK